MKIKKFAAFALMLSVIAGAMAVFSVPMAAESLPAAFPARSIEINYDDLPYSTEAKNQNPHGTCWAFSAVACAEADAIKNHGANKYSIDLSEWHLSYFAYHGMREGTGDSVSLSGDKPYYSLGGYEMLSALTLSSGIGFANEKLAPYDVLLGDPDAELSISSMYECEYRIDNVILLDIVNDPEAVKEAIYEYGAVTANYYSDFAYLNMGENGKAPTYAQYCKDPSLTADHAITIVGWDDNYSRANFSTKYGRPMGNGAWLVKNSWGTDFGFSGYFWISYYDATLTGGAAFDVVPADTYDNIYQHDGGITMQYVDTSFSDEIVNVFNCEVRGSELLTAVGVSVTDRGNSNEYTLRIYSEPQYDKKNGFTYGRILLVQNGYLHSGYNSIPLDAPIELNRGDSFAVSISTDAGIMVDGDSVSELVSGTFYTSEADVLDGQTFYKEGGDPWKDAATDSTPWNARIKALTVSANKRSEPMLSALPEISTLSYGEPLSAAQIVGGEVLDPNTGDVISGIWRFKDETMIPDTDQCKVRLVFIPDDILKYTTMEVSVIVFVDMINEDVVPLPPVKEEITERPEFDVHDPSDYENSDNVDKNDGIFDTNGLGIDLDKLLDTVMDVFSAFMEMWMIWLPILIVFLVALVIAAILGALAGISALAGLIVGILMKPFFAIKRKRKE